MPQWIDAGPLAALKERGRRVFKAGRKQILLIAAGDRVFACNNRCPHEGYPLSEGTVGTPCTLTCNWHNWKFDLASGETRVGGDRLRHYPLEERNGHIWIDVADLPAEQRQARALANLDEAFVDNDYERIAREVARYIRADSDPLGPLRHAVEVNAARFEFGMTHAYAATPDWLALQRIATSEEEKITTIIEPIAHIAWDSLRQPQFPYTDNRAPWAADAFTAGIEAEDEQTAISLLNGAFAEGRPHDELKRAFAKAALAHYQDFGHSAIYVRKAFELIDALGQESAPAILRSLTRSIAYATREDKIPEFRDYPKALASPPHEKRAAVTATELVGHSVNATLDRILSMAGSNEEKYKALLEAAAIAMLRYDMSVDLHVEKPISHNVRWLDFTHALTFANAVRQLCAQSPELWPAALLQMGCFLGRNAPFLCADVDDGWFEDDATPFLASEQRALFDHGIREPIIACHRVKVLAAVKEEAAWAGPGSLTRNLIAATNRYLHTPIKGHHSLRAARQALSFVDAEG